MTLHNMNAYVPTLHVYITNHTEHSMQRGMNLLENHPPSQGKPTPENENFLTSPSEGKAPPEYENFLASP